MNWLDLIIILVLIGGIFSGYRNGLIGEVASLAGLILGIWGAVRFSWWAAELLEGFGLSFSLMPVISFVITFLVIVLLVQAVAGLVRHLLESISLGWFNKIAGIAAGVAKAAIIGSVILILISSFDDRQRFLREEVKEGSLLYKPLSELVPGLMPFLKIQHLKEPEMGGREGREGDTV
ncbi:MAG: CvpA family protein [Bacteroidales bacterium]